MYDSIKDAAIMSNCDSLEDEENGLIELQTMIVLVVGIEAWLELGEAVGLKKEDLININFTPIS